MFRVNHLTLRLALIGAIAILLVDSACGQSLTAQEIDVHFKWVSKQLSNPKTSAPLMCAHRGDWRHAPENSIQSLQNAIEKGYDIVELDLKRTKDGVLIVLHDPTLDRTTTGTGSPSDYTLAELKQLRLRHATGHPSRHSIPTLDEFLDVAKGRIHLCIDKGFDYFEQAMAQVNAREMESQVIFNIPAMTYEKLQSLKLSGMSDRLLINLLQFPKDTATAGEIVRSYIPRGRTIIHPVLPSDTLAIVPWFKKMRALGIHVWLNALWPEHSGGHDDDRAVELRQPEQSWGWLIKTGATIIQTDRPTDLKQFNKKSKKNKNP